MKPESELIRGIEQQTQNEIDSLAAQLAKLELDRGRAVEEEIELLRRNMERRSESQRQRIDRAAKALIATERHRIELEASNRFFDQVLRECTKRLHALAADKRYAEVLKRWIVEAAVGLAADEAIVTVSAAERDLCATILKEAEREAGRLIGRPVRLTLDRDHAVGEQGVVLTAASGRTAFNNQVRTRMLRRESDLRRIIYDELSRANRDSETETLQPGENERNDG